MIFQREKIWLVVAMVVIFIPIIIVTESLINKKRSQYIEVNSGIEVVGVINNLFTNQGVSYITIADSSKFWLPNSRNYLYDPPYLYDFIDLKDSVYKQLNSDTLYIYRNQMEYYFVLSRFINEDRYENNQ
jgi:hypothetical protein